MHRVLLFHAVSRPVILLFAATSARLLKFSSGFVHPSRYLSSSLPTAIRSVNVTDEGSVRILSPPDYTKGGSGIFAARIFLYFIKYKK